MVEYRDEWKGAVKSIMYAFTGLIGLLVVEMVFIYRVVGASAGNVILLYIFTIIYMFLVMLCPIEEELKSSTTLEKYVFPKRVQERRNATLKAGIALSLSASPATVVNAYLILHVIMRHASLDAPSWLTQLSVTVNLASFIACLTVASLYVWKLNETHKLQQ